MAKAGIYRAKIYGADIYTDGEYSGPTLTLARCKNMCTPSGVIRTRIRMNRGSMARFGSKISSGRIVRVGR